MFLTIAMILGLGSQAADTTMVVRRGQRLEVSAYAGTVTIRTWNRDALRVEGETGRKDVLEVDARGSTITVETSGRWGPAGDADITVTMPTWMVVEVSGVETDISIEGCRCTISAETVSGDVTVRGGEGSVELQSVEGSVTVSDINGRLEAASVNSDVTVTNVTGNVSAQTVNGDVALENITSAGVEASTVNGDITYHGTIQANGHYEFSTHQGDLLVAMPETANASVTVNTFNGSFESDFPVTLSGRSQRKKFTFTLGTGSARVTLESFGGDIQLVRPGSRAVKPGKGKEHDR